ncbi:MAG: DHA2 family efflux MFS transporter permease subunit [Nocardioides sp.]|uniref:DHA2 family efflux MFS transporter permease subunit n=1 Tax=Nocardioides sp. TaxID=35761 RepID=UPI0039E27932
MSRYDSSEPGLAAVHDPRGPTSIDRHAWQVLAVSGIAVYVVFLDATIVNIAFPAISAAFPGSSSRGLSWVLNAYAVVFGALLVTTGGLADNRGPKRVFQAGLLAFGAASGLCGLSPTLGLLIAARAVQATGAALLVPASLALLLPEFPVNRRAAAVGLWGAVGALASATGPSLGALLTEGPGWRWIFFVNVPLCAMAWLAGRKVLRESTLTRTGRRSDLAGVVLVIAVFGLISLGVVQGQQWGWASDRTIGALGTAAVLAPLLIWRGLRHAHPALPVRLFANRSFAAATAATLFYGAAFYAQILCNVLFLHEVWGYSLLRTALAVLPGPLVAVLVAPLAGRLADRVGYLVVVVPGAIVFVAGSLWFASSVTAEPAYVAHMLPGLLLAGASIGATFATLAAAATASLTAPQFGIGSAVNSMARQLGAVIGVAALIAVLTNAAPLNPVPTFHDAWRLIAIFAAVCALASLALGRRVVMVSDTDR